MLSDPWFILISLTFWGLFKFLKNKLYKLNFERRKKMKNKIKNSTNKLNNIIGFTSGMMTILGVNGSGSTRLAK
ncbi:hypothetical protein Belba_0593 [Belliella baltica DSM 15883]|uniref:Uncharacterized protein n=1 Tax=Belliella baltica (strain DSM 15883 / CIP 108006 / LMG 21964 / BA134) TaxID=866536 RepID=I3Z1Y2_BELBD|nr:hypothetical protein Belba_0593 [Belliella baltica DSM 15883]